MSNLTDEFAAAIAELASELGQGLTATLLQRTGTYDPDTQSYLDPEVVEHDFACAPPSEDRGTVPGSPEVLRGSLQIIIPTTDSAGESIEPVVGDRVRVGSVIYQIATVVQLNIGTGIAAYECEVRQ